MTYIPRTLEKEIKELNNQFKVLLLTGARQTGKSTILKHCDNKRNYVTLDDFVERQLALNNPVFFLQKHRPPVIIDEIQYAPNLLSYIKMKVDVSSNMGQYWLTGSQQFKMMKNVSESLAGRVAVINLLPLSLKETEKNLQIPFLSVINNLDEKQKNFKQYELFDIFKIIQRGFYPEINANQNKKLETFYSSYIQTYIERDIKDLNAVKNELDFIRFLKITAARTGQMLNYADIAHDLGVALTTVKSWISILVSSDIIHLIQPYYNNINNRIVKTPKMYFCDTGLCSYLSGWNNPQALEVGAMNGAMFETFVVNEIIKSYKHNGLEPNLYYYRDKDKREIDLIFEQNGKLYPIEIKKTASPDKKMIKNFSVIPEKIRGNGTLICLYDSVIPLNDKDYSIPVGFI